MHNHFIVHAARGVTHVWTAAIVAGLAVVLTGSIAYTAVHAEDVQNDPTMLMLLSLRRIEIRLDRMEPKVNYLYAQAGGATETTATSGTRAVPPQEMRPEAKQPEAKQKETPETAPDHAMTPEATTTEGP